MLLNLLTLTFVYFYILCEDAVVIESRLIIQINFEIFTTTISIKAFRKQRII